VTFTPGTEAYARHVGRYGAALSAAHADAAGLETGETALDVGCGPGVLLTDLARRLGPERVAGVDPSEPFVAAARAAVTDADVRLAAAEQVPFPDGSFDIVLSQLVVNFMSDPEAGVAEMRRVARRTVTSCVWDYAGEMTMLRAFWDAALDPDPAAPDEGRTMRHCSPDELGALWTGARLRDVESSALVVEAAYVETVLRIYTAHYNGERPHRGLALLPPDPTNADPPASHGEIKRRDRLGGLIHEYHRAAA
jgi:SAM-dependent methyltransferase